jgi:hypothetical protein
MQFCSIRYYSDIIRRHDHLEIHRMHNLPSMSYSSCSAGSGGTCRPLSTVTGVQLCRGPEELILVGEKITVDQVIQLSHK